jgi:PII-like signaling protein
MIWSDAVLLRIHLGSADQISGESAFDWLIQQARHAGLRGATVTQGIAGFGPDGALRRATLFHFTQNLPVTVELVDEEPAIGRFLQGVTPHLPVAALVTTQPVQALRRRP